MREVPDRAAPAGFRARGIVRDAANFQEAVAAALAEVSLLHGAARVGLILAEDPQSSEYWHPLDDLPRDERRAFREAARCARQGEPVPGSFGAQCLEAAGAVRGVVVWLRADAQAQRQAAADSEPVAEAQTETEVAAAQAALLGLLAVRVAHHQEAVRGQATHAQYERWFRTMDEQVRVLDRERQKFAAIVHRFDAGVFVADTARRIRWTNSQMAATPAPGPEGTTWIGQGCHAVCVHYGASEAAEECADCPVAKAFENNEVVHCEFRHSEGGEMRSHYLSALPIKGPDGRPHEVMVLIQDLSDLEIVRKSEARYRLLFDRSARAILMVDPVTRRILLANPMASRMTGYSRETLEKLRLEDLHDAGEWARLEADYARAFGEGTLTPRPCRVTTTDGGVRETVVSGTRYELGTQEVVMIDFEDVTESVRIRGQLEEAEARLRTIVSNSPLVLFSVDRHGVFTLSEGRGLENLGLKPGQLVGQSAWEIYGDHPTILECLQRALDGETFSETIPLGTLHFETHYAPTWDEAGRVTGLIGVATDISERRALESQLRHAQRMEAIGRLAGGVAHDFNNLLAAILGHGELMISELPAAHPLRRNAEEIQRAGVRGALLTRQLLAFSRNEVLTPLVLDLNVVMMALEELLNRLIGEDIDLLMVPATRPILVRADRGQIEQVIMNLVINARDAMPQGGRLEVQVGAAELDEAYTRQHPRVRPGHYAVLSVTDSGIGMDADTLAHAFEPFYTTKEQGKGTGLGLATVYGIAESSHGHVWVYSEPGIGTTFRVYFPEVHGAPGDAHEEPAAQVDTSGTETILLVEDEDTVRQLGLEVLTSSGYHVLEAVDGVHALEVAGAFNGPIHMLITDVVMPRMGGGELVGRFLEARPGIRVLFVSGYTNDSVVRHGVRDRQSAFLQKPFALEAFARKVREVLDAPFIEPGILRGHEGTRGT